MTHQRLQSAGQGAAAVDAASQWTASVLHGLGMEEAAAWAAKWLRRIGGEVRVEGSALPAASTLAPIVQAALQQVLRPEAGQPPPLVRVHSGRAEDACTTRFGFEVASHAVDPVLRQLADEVACNGAARLLPALAALLEEKAPECRHCRVRLLIEGQPPAGSSPRGGGGEPRPSWGLSLPDDADAPTDGADAHEAPPWPGAAQHPRASLSFGPAALQAGVSPVPSSAQRPLASVVTARHQGARATCMQERSESPTAMNLARDPALRARVMSEAVPLESDRGRRLSGLVPRAASASPPRR